MPMEEKKSYGRVVIDNNGTLAELRNKVDEIWKREFSAAKRR